MPNDDKNDRAKEKISEWYDGQILTPTLELEKSQTVRAGEKKKDEIEKLVRVKLSGVKIRHMNNKTMKQVTGKIR